MPIIYRILSLLLQCIYLFWRKSDLCVFWFAQYSGWNNLYYFALALAPALSQSLYASVQHEHINQLIVLPLILLRLAFCCWSYSISWRYIVVVTDVIVAVAVATASMLPKLNYSVRLQADHKCSALLLNMVPGAWCNVFRLKFTALLTNQSSKPKQLGVYFDRCRMRHLPL